MSIGTPINLSLPTVGTTAKALVKERDGLYRLSEADSEGNPVFIELTLRAVAVDSPVKVINITLRKNPSTYDNQYDHIQGRVSLSFQANCVIGEAVSQTTVSDYCRYLGSVLAQSSIIDALLLGSLQ